MDRPELKWILYTVEKLPDDGVVVELGSYCGRATAAMCQGILGRGGTVIAVDPFDDADMARRGLKSKTKCMLDTFKQVMATLDFSPTIWQMTSLEAAAQTEDQSIDMIFIDAIHYDVGEDIDAWRSKMKPGSIMSGHDFPGPSFDVEGQVLKRFPNVSQGPMKIWYTNV